MATNNSVLFKQAHSIARDTVATVGNYQIAFTLALRSLYAKQKQVKPAYNYDSADWVAHENALVVGYIIFAIIIITSGVYAAVMTSSAFTGLFVATTLGAITGILAGITGGIVAYTIQMATHYIEYKLL